MAKPMRDWTTKELRAELDRLGVGSVPQWNKGRLRMMVWNEWQKQVSKLFEGPGGGGFVMLPFCRGWSSDDGLDRTYDGRDSYESTHGDERAVLVRMLATHFASFWPEVADVIEVQK